MHDNVTCVLMFSVCRIFSISKMKVCPCQEITTSDFKMMSIIFNDRKCSCKETVIQLFPVSEFEKKEDKF
jgi:hypothetical protein